MSDKLKVIYDAICNDIKGKVISWRGFKIPRIQINGPLVTCQFDTMSTQELNTWITEKDLKQAMVKYIKTKHSFHGDPAISFNSFIYDDRGDPRSDIRKKSDMFSGGFSQPKFNYEAGAIEFNAFLPEINKSATKEMLDDFDRLLFVLSGEDESTYSCLMRYIAQYTFETKATNRPTLILEGIRGTGKNFLVESILSKIWPHEYKKSPSNFESFSSFTSNKLVYFDEVRAINFSTNVYDMVKNISGSEFLSYNQKFIAERTVKGKTHIVLSSNGKPLHIPYREMPRSERENQFLCIHYEKELAKSPVYRELMRKYAINSRLDDYIKMILGKWLNDRIFPIYKSEMCKSNDRPRYGFIIPINDALKGLMRMSETDDDNNALHLLEHVMRVSPYLREAVRDEYHAEAGDIVHLLEMDKVLTNDVINAMLRRMKIPMTLQRFIKTAEKFGIITRRIKKNNKRGHVLDWDKLVKKMDEYDAIDKEEAEGIASEFEDLDFE